MMRRIQALKFVFPGLLLFAHYSWAGVLFESAKLGTPGIASGGYYLCKSQFLGAGFTLVAPVKITAIGGHISSEGKIFGAIVELTSSTEMPSFGPLDIGAKAIASVVFTAPDKSADIVVPVSLTLPPGHYGLIFGSGVFGADGTGYMPVPADTGADDLPGVNYFSTTAFGSQAHRKWESGRFHAARFVVYGEAIPAPPPSPKSP